MRVLLTLLSLLLLIPTIQMTASSSLEDDVQRNNGENSQTCVFYSYEEGASHAREAGKNTVIVLYSRGGDFAELESMARDIARSVMSVYANIVVLSQTGINLLIHPPVPDPMLEEIAKFHRCFPEVKELVGPFLITFSVSGEGERMMDMIAIDLPKEDVARE